MNKTTKILVIALVVVAIVAASILLWPKKQKPGADKEQSQEQANGDDPKDFSTNNNVPGSAAPKSNSAAAGLSVAGSVAGNALSQNLPKVGSFPITEGSRGATVKLLQQLINTMIKVGIVKADPLKVDGIWGPKTSAAVRQVWPANTVSQAQFIAKYSEMTGLVGALNFK